jgi:hypothetical protein
MTDLQMKHRITIGAGIWMALIAIVACGLPVTATPAAAAIADTSEAQAWSELVPAMSAAQVVSAVRAAQKLQTVPSNLAPGLSVTTDAAGVPTGKCPSASGVMASQGCAYGDLKSKKLMVVYGDSHAAMWAEALQMIAKNVRWKLIVYAFAGCQAPNVPLISSQTNQLNTQCQQFHVLAAQAIKKLHPNLLIVTSESTGDTSSGTSATPSQWQLGLTKTFASLSEPGTSMVMIGDIPQWPLDDADCLAAHMDSIQSCAAPSNQVLSPNIQAEQKAATLSHVKYISTTAWACAAKCEPVIDNKRVYFNQYHFGAIYTAYLSSVLQQMLSLAP